MKYLCLQDIQHKQSSVGLVLFNWDAECNLDSPASKLATFAAQPSNPHRTLSPIPYGGWKIGALIKSGNIIFCVLKFAFCLINNWVSAVRRNVKPSLHKERVVDTNGCEVCGQTGAPNSFFHVCSIQNNVCSVCSIEISRPHVWETNGQLQEPSQGHFRSRPHPCKPKEPISLHWFSLQALPEAPPKPRGHCLPPQVSSHLRHLLW